MNTTPPSAADICLSHYETALAMRLMRPSEDADRIVAAQRVAWEQARAGRVVVQ